LRRPGRVRHGGVLTLGHASTDPLLRLVGRQWARLIQVSILIFNAKRLLDFSLKHQIEWVSDKLLPRGIIQWLQGGSRVFGSEKISKSARVAASSSGVIAPPPSRDGSFGQFLWSSTSTTVSQPFRTGHQSLEEIERYTRDARKKKLADAAMAKLK